MRIITGKAKGRKIISPDGYNVTRPTLDRIKESIFSIIQRYLNNDSIVLDLFAGTGSLGLEACSRGAKYTYLCDRDDDTFSYLKKNIENLNFENNACAIKGSFENNLKRFSGKEKFDIIFIDPPYHTDYVEKSINIIDKIEILNLDGIIVTKISSNETKFIESSNIMLVDYRKYGNTTVCLYKYKGDYNE